MGSNDLILRKGAIAFGFGKDWMEFPKEGTLSTVTLLGTVEVSEALKPRVVEPLLEKSKVEGDM